MAHQQPTKRPGRHPSDVPIFLQKTYQMIDTCDPEVCTWSDDGTTFVVKNVTLFESTVVPRYFKHSKFSSFVRQLNFYGFRKIKYTNSLRIDTEEETANFWRFKHGRFRRGRTDLLCQIKRNVSAPSSSASKKAPFLKVAAASCGESNDLRVEMRSFKDRMDGMARSIDELTNLVKSASVTDNHELVGAGTKRKKTDVLPTVSAVVSPGNNDQVLPDWTSSMDILSDQMPPDAVASNEELQPDIALSNGAASPLSSQPSSVSDEGFVDDLFRAFADEEGMDGLPTEDEDARAPLSFVEAATPTPLSASSENNRPDPLLMKRIEDSLSTIPRDMHELVANKLIDAISDAGDSLPVARLEEEGKPDCSVSVDDDEDPSTTSAGSGASAIPLSLAVATLKTILSEYGVKVECIAEQTCKDPLLAKQLTSLPVVPLHA